MNILCAPGRFGSLVQLPKAAVDVSSDLLSHLDQLPLKVIPDYYATFRRSVPEAKHFSAEEYLFSQEGYGNLLCPEMAVPKRWAPSIVLNLPTGTRWAEEAVTFLHAGRPNCIAPVHFDWDHTCVAHACLTGRKRLFFLPPQEGWLLCPIINTSSLCIPRMSPADRQDLLERLGGFEVMLEAGQGILFPSMYWHGVLYEESSLSVSVRFEPFAGGRPFAALPRFWLLQRLLWLFFLQGYGEAAEAFLLRYLTQFFMPGTWRQRYRRVSALCQAVLLENGERKGAAFLMGENFSAEMVLAAQELKFYYQDASQNEQARDQIQEAFDYIFRDIKAADPALGMRLASQALGVRQGLAPKRGLARVEEKEILCSGRES